MEIKYSNPKNKYDIISRIGSGTYGEVFKASHLLTGKMYALKSIKVEKDEDFCQIKNEIDVINQCRHKNVVNIYEAFLNRSRLWMCMEICDGGSLQDVLEDIGSLPEMIIAYVIRESVRGLEYIHSCGQIHRDIKGGNILLNSQGEIKLADFGIAASLSKTIAKRCSVLGTPYWMAPEVISAQRTGGYGKSCDIWSIGITTIELADTEPPLYDLHPVAALHLIGKSSYKSPTVKDPSKWSSDMINFVKKTLNKNVRWRLTAKECLNHPFLRNHSLSQQFGLALYNSKLIKLKRNGESPILDETPDLEQEISSGFAEDLPWDHTITGWTPKTEHAESKKDTLTDTISLEFNDDLSFNITENNELCYTWDWRKQIKQPESHGMPKSPCVIMGAGLSKIYENCELDVTSSELWVNSETSEQNILLGSKEGVYLANLVDWGELTPKKIFYKPCLWLHVNMYEMVLVISSVGTIPYLFTIDMVNLCKSGFEINKSSKLSDIFSFKHKKSILFNKMEETKDIEKCVAFRSSISCEDCLLCSLNDQVVLMQWFLPYRRYMLIKRILVGIPKGINFTNEPLSTLDKAYPYLCFGVSSNSEMQNDKSVKFDYVDINLHTGWGAFKGKSKDVTCNTLKAIFIGQLSNDTVVVGFENWAGVYDLEGLVVGSELLTFDVQVQDYVIISGALLAIHKHGVIGKNYENKLIQNIYDPSRVFTLLGSKGFIVLKTVDEWETVDLHVLTGHENMI